MRAPTSPELDLDELLASGDMPVEAPAALTVLRAELRAQVREARGDVPAHDRDDVEERFQRALVELDATLDELREGAQEVMADGISPWGRFAMAFMAGVVIARTGTARWLLRNGARLAVAVAARELLRRSFAQPASADAG